MKRRMSALARLLAVQGSWNYERMQGVGLGFAAAPLLEPLETEDPARHAAAVVRSAEFFNANPYLASVALGATVRAEYDGVPPEQVGRLRTALCGPLGAMGDALFWAGVLPTLLGAAITAIALGARWWPVMGFLLVFNALRLVTMRWGLATGLANGMRVGAAIGASPLPRLATRAGIAAAFAVGAAVPLAGAWLAHPFGWRGTAGAAGIAMAGLALSHWFGAQFTAPRFGLLALGATLLIRWVTA